MKNIYLTTLFIITLISYSFAQNKEFVWHQGYISKAFDVKYASTDNAWIVAGSEYVPTPAFTFLESSSFLSKFDSLGNEVWRVSSIIPFEVNAIHSVEVLGNGNILLLPNSEGCDFGYLDSLMLFNPQGQFISGIPSPNSGWSKVTLKAVGNNQFLIGWQHHLMLMDENWNVIWEKANSNLGIPHSFEILSSGNFFVFSTAGAHRVLASDGTFVGAYYTAGNVKGTQQTDDFFYMIDDTTRTVSLIDTNFNFGFAAFSVANHFDEIIKVEAIDFTKTAILGVKDSIILLKTFDNGFTAIDSAMLDNNHYLTETFAISPTEIGIVGSEFTALAPVGNYINYVTEGSALACFKTYDHDLNTSNSMIDVGVTAFNNTAISSIFDSCYASGGWTYFYHHTFLNATATVTNFGSQPIDKVSIYSRSDYDCMHFCPLHEVQQWTFNTNIQPGQSVTLNLQNFTIADDNLVDVHLWTGAPNNKMDSNHNNDEYFQTTVVVVNTIEPISIRELNIFPNPATNVLNISTGTSENLRIQIINTAGQIIVDDLVISLQNQSIDISNLPTGFYVVKGITDDGQSHVGKFIKH